MMTNSVSLHSNLLGRSLVALFCHFNPLVTTAPSDDTSIREKLSSPIQVPPQAWDRTPRDEIINYTSSPLSDRRKPRPRSVAFIGQESPSIDPQRSSPMRRSKAIIGLGMSHLLWRDFPFKNGTPPLEQ